MVANNDVELFYLVHLSKAGAKNSKCFVCTKRRGDEVTSLNCFHGIGYFHVSLSGETEDEKFNLNGREEKEVWIPYDKIDFIESLVYRPR